MTADRNRSVVPPSSQEVAGPVGRLVAVNASAFPISAAGWLTAWALDGVEHATVLELARLDAAALLGRRLHRSVGEAIESITAAASVLIVTPVYRRSYSGVLKVFFDLLPPAVLEGTHCALVATGPDPAAPPGLEGAAADLVDSVGGRLRRRSVYVPTADIDPETGIGAAALGLLREAVRQITSGGSPSRAGPIAVTNAPHGWPGQTLAALCYGPSAGAGRSVSSRRRVGSARGLECRQRTGHRRGDGRCAAGESDADGDGADRR